MSLDGLRNADVAEALSSGVFGELYSNRGQVFVAARPSLALSSQRTGSMLYSMTRMRANGAERSYTSEEVASSTPILHSNINAASNRPNKQHT